MILTYQDLMADILLFTHFKNKFTLEELFFNKIMHMHEIWKNCFHDVFRIFFFRTCSLILTSEKGILLRILFLF